MPMGIAIGHFAVYKAVYILHACGVKAFQSYTAKTALYSAIQYTAIQRYTLYKLYITPLHVGLWGQGGTGCGLAGRRRALGCRLEVERTEPPYQLPLLWTGVRHHPPRRTDNGSFAAMFRFYGTERFFPDHLIITS